MATISTASIQDGQIIYAAHLLRVIQALDGNQAKTIIINGDFTQGALNNTTDGTTSFSQGSGSIASGLYSHAEGRITNATGDYAHSEGYDNTASGDYAHSEGDNTAAGGFASHAEGNSTSTSANYAHSEGDSTQANGEASHTEGESTITSGYASHAEGFSTLANGDYSHAEGYQTVAAVFYSHAEGYQTLASGNQSHTEGYLTTASANGAHAEGRNTLASGLFSHAEGSSSVAYGAASHAEGWGTVSSGSYQTVVGQFNTQNNTTDYFVIGVGTAGVRADGLGVNDTRTYISNSLFLPNLTNTGQNRVATLDSTGKLYYAASESIRVTSASYAITASYAENAAGATPGGSPNQIQYNNGGAFGGITGFNYLGSNTLQYTGSFTVSSSLNVIGISKTTGSLAVSGSGSSIVSIKGTTGPLLTVNDTNSGSLFTVNDISGMPVLDVRSDSSTLIGSSTSLSLNSTKKVISTGAQAFSLGGTLIPTASYDGAFFEYTAKSGSNARSGYITSTWSGSTIVSSSITSSNIGDTSGLTTFVALSGSYIVLSGSANAANWTVKSIIRAI